MDIQSSFKQKLQSHTVTVALAAIAVLVLILGAFSLGESIGYHKASFAFQNGNSFYGTFGPHRGPIMFQGNFSDTHGTAGKVINIALPAITIEDKDGTEKTIVTSDQTIVRQFRDTVSVQTIKVGDYIVAIGEPNAQSQIVANLIRLLPPMPANTAQQP